MIQFIKKNEDVFGGPHCGKQVEIKRRKEIGREVIDEVDAKVNALMRRAGVSIRAALVYDGHLSPVVAADGYFDAIIPFSSLLE